MEVLASTVKCEENVVEINQYFGEYYPFFGEYLEIVISPLQVDVYSLQIWFPFLVSHKDCVCKNFHSGAKNFFADDKNDTKNIAIRLQTFRNTSANRGRKFKPL